MSAKTIASSSEGLGVSFAPPFMVVPETASLNSLISGQETEVLSFLEQRPLHTVVMAGHIRDNGLEGPFNRGRFYSCRNDAGELDGVALIGHATLLETRSDAALAAFAILARTRPEAHLIMGEQDKIQRFWNTYAGAEHDPRRICRELLFEQRRPVKSINPVLDLRLATLADLESVMLVQAQMAFDESGINPLEIDPEGFRERCSLRIERKRVWVWVDSGRLIFKADVMSATPQVFYLEGIYVNPHDRSKGIGTRCVSQLSQTLLTHTNSLSILVNEQRARARYFFERVGFQLQCCYDTIFLNQNGA